MNKSQTLIRALFTIYRKLGSTYNIINPYHISKIHGNNMIFATHLKFELFKNKYFFNR